MENLSNLKWYLSGAHILKMLPDSALCHRLFTFLSSFANKTIQSYCFFLYLQIIYNKDFIKSKLFFIFVTYN